MAEAQRPLLKQSQVQQQTQAQIQRLVMLPQMQQALHILQMPVMELTSLVDTSLAENPIVSDTDEEEEVETNPDDEELPSEQELTFDDTDLGILQHLDTEFRELFFQSQEAREPYTKEDEEHRIFFEESLVNHPSLFEHLMQQASETFDAPDLAIAEALIGNFDSSGFLLSSWEELMFLYRFPKEKMTAILKQIQHFEPFGVGATSLQESLLIQLRNKGLSHTLAAKIITNHYEDLLHNRIPIIQKHLHCSDTEIAEALHVISQLDLHPGAAYSWHHVQTIVPDLTITQEGSNLHLIVNDDFTPKLRTNPLYMRMLEDPTASFETKEFIRNKLANLKWLMRNIHERKTTLERIGQYFIKHQGEFLLSENGKLLPMSMKQIAEDLKLHESTVTRAVSNKYIDCPRGLLPLRSFFTAGYVANDGTDLSARTVKDALLALIHDEDRQHPLSDASLARQLEAKGMHCARRTVAKYREELNIGNAHQRRKHDKILEVS